ncbi:13099_t:CDS:2 [Funneliformis mosseae]|uniref:13099_t:CDS:1 n=1 Tax=Funneliformis mosseae TaxID=27381 RepID=A0A9N9CK21_FUNMO|nr:13099_t:CDS:2 [Funneliformis mosseae]
MLSAKFNSSNKTSSSVDSSKLNDDVNYKDSNETAAVPDETVVNSTDSESNVIAGSNNNKKISPLNNDGIIENNKSDEIYHAKDTPPNTPTRKSSTTSINRISSSQPTTSALQPYVINDVDKGKKQDGIDESTLPGNSTSLPTTEIPDAKVLESTATSSSTVVDNVTDGNRMANQSTEREIVVAKDDGDNKNNKSILKKWKRKVNNSVKKAIRKISR